MIEYGLIVSISVLMFSLFGFFDIEEEIYVLYV